MPKTIGGMPEPARGEVYTSPLKTFGIDLGLGSYAVSAAIGFIYIASVYPLQALFGHGKPEPVALWLLLPIAGPWFAQYEGLVRDKPFWRGLLIADASMQAVGLVVGLIGAALSGRRVRSSDRARSLELRWGVAGGGLGLSVAVHSS